ncbi:hypothetical protein [Desulfosporosinus sp. OT]|uniref:hypothetical protein n=1 Tax=Desulfosporosinus sp. OT TaxID=913865 RepID=UPI000223AD0B|nr:hypothetical protein [Desulfosporosinus sp. OT]EGW41749.1 hypothetical protein DOT_0274 [Desulfosporosinus sp. OT]
MRYLDTTELLQKRSSWGDRTELWKNEQLREDFKELFYGKCWYTEIKLLGQDVHIDHFRPKAEVRRFQDNPYNEPLQHTGYSWLANDEANYRACCIYANRVTGEGGKGCYFPLQEGSPYLTRGGSEDEQPLLLDPCKQDDVNVLTFFGGDVLCASNEPIDIKRVEISKTLYNLSEQSIKSARARLWEDISRTLAEYSTGDISRKACLRRLSDAISPEAQFSACAMACVNSLAQDELKADLDLEL